MWAGRALLPPQTRTIWKRFPCRQDSLALPLLECGEDGQGNLPFPSMTTKLKGRVLSPTHFIDRERGN